MQSAGGIEAGYRWPQYAVHRGRLYMLLYRRLVDLAGAGRRSAWIGVTGYARRDGGVQVQISDADGSLSQDQARLLIGADGIHSAIRAAMVPDQAPIHWGGAVMWRGTVRPSRCARPPHLWALERTGTGW